MTGKDQSILSLKRTKCKALVGLITGHCLIGVHAYRMRIISNAWCRNCNEPDEDETIEHLLCFCPALARRRYKIFGKLFLNSLQELKNIKLYKLVDFITSTNTFELDNNHLQRLQIFESL